VSCWRRLKVWEEAGIWIAAWRELLSTLDRRALLNWEETFADGSFAPPEKEHPSSEPRSAGGGPGDGRESGDSGARAAVEAGQYLGQIGAQGRSRRQVSTTERMAAIRGPASALPRWIQFFRPSASGRIEVLCPVIAELEFGVTIYDALH